MKGSAVRLLFWTPRILGILVAAFISIFAFDVFGQEHTFWETVLALALHLVPTAVILVALAIAWRWEWVGGLLFLALGGFYISVFREGDWIAYLIISGPLFLVSILFLADWWYRARHRSRSE